MRNDILSTDVLIKTKIEKYDYLINLEYPKSKIKKIVEQIESSYLKNNIFHKICESTESRKDYCREKSTRLIEILSTNKISSRSLFLFLSELMGINVLEPFFLSMTSNFLNSFIVDSLNSSSEDVEDTSKVVEEKGDVRVIIKNKYRIQVTLHCNMSHHI